MGARGRARGNSHSLTAAAAVQNLIEFPPPEIIYFNCSLELASL